MVIRTSQLLQIYGYGLVVVVVVAVANAGFVFWYRWLFGNRSVFVFQVFGGAQ